MRRRAFLAGALALAATPRLASGTAYPLVVRGQALDFPRDHGSHPDYRTEWWYLTGWLRSASGREFGMQITFFRSRPGIGEDNPSRFAPRQLLFAHAAVSEARLGRLLQEERAARVGFGVAEAGSKDTDLRLQDWTLGRAARGYRASITAREFAYALVFRPTQAVLLQGELGYSRKGPDPRQASYYYSQPQLAVSGEATIHGEKFSVEGRAWLDHEWSSQGMAAQAVGWDWTGLNLADGGALMAFQMRDAQGAPVWAGGTYRDARGALKRYAPSDISFTPLRRWRSPRTQAEYPVALRVRAGAMQWELAPSMDDQEIDARASTGTVYWEGAVAASSGAATGRGYLELTGYWKPLRL